MDQQPKVNTKQAVYRVKLQTKDSLSKITIINVWSSALVWRHI